MKSDAAPPDADPSRTALIAIIGARLVETGAPLWGFGARPARVAAAAAGGAAG